jgi:hypothetical protein
MQFRPQLLFSLTPRNEIAVARGAVGRSEETTNAASTEAATMTKRADIDDAGNPS